MLYKDLKKIARVRKVFNYAKLSKNDLFYTLLRSEKSPQEEQYLKRMNYKTREDLKERINHILMLLAKLGNKITNRDRKNIIKKLIEIENEDHTNITRERAIRYLLKETNNLYNIEKQHTKQHHDQVYYGLKDIQNIFNDYDDDYYVPMLVRTSFNKKYEEYEIRGDRHKNLSVKEYVAIIYPHIKKLLDKKKNDTKKEQKIQLSIAVTFTHITDALNKYIIYIKSKNITMRYAEDTFDIMTKLYDSFLENYEAEEIILRRGSNFVYDSVDVSFIKIYKTKLKRGGTYIETPKWVLDKKATINPKNTRDNYCFAYLIVAAMHHHEIDHHLDRITKLTPFINNYNWKNINFPTEHKDYKKFECNNKDIALNILSAHNTKKKINIIYKSDHNRKRKHQVILLMVTDNNNNWHYIAVKSISRLLKGISSNSNCNNYCLNCLHAYRTENKLIRHERICNDNTYCNPLMPEKGKNFSKYIQDKKSILVPHVVYADLECLLRQIESRKDNPKNSYTLKKKHTHTIWVFNTISKILWWKLKYTLSRNRLYV